MEQATMHLPKTPRRETRNDRVKHGNAQKFLIRSKINDGLCEKNKATANNSARISKGYLPKSRVLRI
jgi:hypothetical protein